MVVEKKSRLFFPPFAAKTFFIVFARRNRHNGLAFRF